MRILWAVRVGAEDWDEQLITENESAIARASEWALANGFDRLRVADIDMTTAPDFAKTLNI